MMSDTTFSKDFLLHTLKKNCIKYKFAVKDEYVNLNHLRNFKSKYKRHGMSHLIKISTEGSYLNLCKATVPT